jgi:hypothetical protein
LLRATAIKMNEGNMLYNLNINRGEITFVNSPAPRCPRDQYASSISIGFGLAFSVIRRILAGICATDQTGSASRLGRCCCLFTFAYNKKSLIRRFWLVGDLPSDASGLKYSFAGNCVYDSNPIIVGALPSNCIMCSMAFTNRTRKESQVHLCPKRATSQNFIQAHF